MPESIQEEYREEMYRYVYFDLTPGDKAIPVSFPFTSDVVILGVVLSNRTKPTSHPPDTE